MTFVQVERHVALPYAQTVFERGEGRAMARIVQATVDLGGGSFDGTAAFEVFAPDSWAVTSAGARQNRVADPSSERGWRSDFEAPVREWLASELVQPGHALVVEGWHISARHKAPPTKGWRFVQLPAEGGFEDYLVVVAPTDDEEAIDVALGACPPHWCLGAVVGTSGVEAHLPTHNDELDEGTLRTMLTDVLGLFMRLPSYDGYLIWRRDDS